MDDTPAINDGADASLRKTVSLLNQIEANTSSSFGASTDDLPHVNDGADASLRKTVRLLNKIEANTSSGTSNLGTKVGVQWTDRHTEGLGNPYLVGSIVYSAGRVYRCLAQNDSIPPVQGGNEYWQDLGEGFLLPNENPKIIGGSINTSGGLLGAGGSINTSNGGGSINLTGKGSIQFGDAGQRTILVGTAQSDLPNYNYVSQIIISGTSTPNLNGTYTSIGIPNLNGDGYPVNYTFSGPSNGFSLSWNENEQRFELFDGDGHGLASNNGIDWVVGFQYLGQVVISGFTGNYDVANGIYDYSPDFEAPALNGRFYIYDGELRDYENENSVLATNTNPGYSGTWDLVNGEGTPETQSITLSPTGTVSGSITTTTVVPPTTPKTLSLPNKNGTLLVGNQSGNGGSINLSNGGGSIISTGYSDNLFGGSLNMSAGNDGDGGSINTSSGLTEGIGGFINTSADGNGSSGGFINTGSGPEGNGGSINTSNNGGSINTSGMSYDYPGGSINTSGSADLSGGSINTSNGGGSIDTKLGFIELGDNEDGARTTLRHKADEDHQNLQIYLPDQSGTLVADSQLTDIIADIRQASAFSGGYPNIPWHINVSPFSGQLPISFKRDIIAAASNPLLPFTTEPAYEPGYSVLPYLEYRIVVGTDGRCSLQSIYRYPAGEYSGDVYEDIPGQPPRYVYVEILNLFHFNYSELYQTLTGTSGYAEFSTANWTLGGDSSTGDRPGAEGYVEFQRGSKGLEAQALSQGKGVLQVGTSTLYRHPITQQYSFISQPTTIIGTATTTARTLYLPDKSGTIATMTDIATPILPTFTLSAGNLNLSDTSDYSIAIPDLLNTTEGFPCVLESMSLLITNRQGTGTVYSTAGNVSVTIPRFGSSVSLPLSTRPLTGSLYHVNVSSSTTGTGLQALTSATSPPWFRLLANQYLFSTLRNNVTSATDTTIPLTSAPFDGGYQTYVRVGTEIMLVTGYQSAVAGQVRAYVLRGQLGTTAQTHTQTTQVVATPGPAATAKLYLNFRKLK